MRFGRMMVSVLALWMVAMLLPTNASAQFRLRVESLDANGNATGVVVSDGGPGDETVLAGVGDLQPGVILVNLPGLNGQNSMSLTVGQTKPVVLTPGVLAEMFLNSITVTTTSSANLRLTLEDTNYPLPSAPSTLQINNAVSQVTFSAPAGSSMTTQAWSNTDPNIVPALGADQSTIGSLGPIGGNIASAGTDALSFAPGSLGGANSSGAFVAPGAFSLFTQVLLNFTGAGSISFVQDTTVVQSAELPTPEPASLLLIATGVIGLGSKMRRSRFARA